MRRLTLLLLASALSVATPSRALAEPPAAGPSAESAAAAAARAKDLNKKGIAMLDAGDVERALAYFMQSRAELPTSKNTTNAAIALERLGRYDESLELYEELLLKYAGGLDDDDRAAIAPAMDALRKRVGSVDVASNVGGEVVVDGRPRGRLPLVVPLRVLAGKHTVRVSRVGYEPFEGAFEVGAAESVHVDAKLEARRGVGQILVEEVNGAHAEVFVDGARVGLAPWEGAIPPGDHLVWLRDGDARGSMPAWVRVTEGQAALSRHQDLPLGPPLSVEVEPRTAAFEIGGVALGPRSFHGRLPRGSYVLSASEPGYVSERATLDLDDPAKPVSRTVSLKIDATHPRWPKPRGAFVAEIFGGPEIGPGLASDVTRGCPSACSGVSPAYGGMVGARAGYRFPFGLGFEVGGGYLTLRQTVRHRAATSTFGDAATRVTYDLADDVHVHGPFVAVGASLRRKVAAHFFLGGRLSVGVAIATAGDPVRGTAKTTGPTVPIVVQKRDETALAGAPFVEPDLVAGVVAGRLEVGLGLGAAFFPALGPRLSRGRVGARTSPGNPDPAAVENAQETNVLEGERAFGRFWTFVPTITVGASF
jgi:hypothetical protein